MLNGYTTRRMAAVLALAGMTNAAGFLAAQPPTARTGKKSPTLIADCDVTQTSCGGDPTLGGGGTFGGYVPPADAPKPECWAGTQVKCGTDTAFTCAQWVIVGGSGSGSVNGGVTWGGSASGTVTKVCGSWIYSTRILYWSK